MGSVIMFVLVPFYQLAFLTPGISPSSANSRKQIRHTPNLRYTARGRPQSLHRRTIREVNLGLRRAAAIFDLLAMQIPVRLTFVRAGRWPTL
jgi:hypothetical protein